MGGSRLLEERLIACANLLPGARSLYRWKGGIEESSEMIVLLKTGSATAPACMTRLAELHPYEVPEILQIHPEAVTGPYAEWIAEVTGG
jgi:periplasmic divalent cation tolerance protein